MRKTLLAAAIVTIGLVSAQETRFGVKGGYSMSMLNTKYEVADVEINSKAKHTFYVAGLAEHKFNDQFAVQAELGYSQLGGKYNSSEMDINNETITMSNKITLGTVYVPLMAKYYFTEFMNVHLGANLQYVVSAKSKVGENLGDDSLGLGDWVEDMVGEERDIKKYVKPFSVSPFVGVEYNLENGIFFDARYYLGVMNIADKTEVTGIKSMKNSFFQVGMGFKFGGN